MLAALLQFANRESETVTSAALCAGARVSRQYVRNLLPRLKSNGILTGVGNAGYRLAKPLSEITVLDVLEAIDGRVSVDQDDLPTGLSDVSVRTLRLTFDGVAGDVAARLRALTLAELA